ncbi:MAG: secondary thiamine-phosphate synthase enzyme YjbQ [Candidatus Aminicenantales bacterium]
MTVIEVETHKKQDLIDITLQVEEKVRSSGIKNGNCLVYVPHTTAGVTINENADPSVKEDILMTLEKLIPSHLHFRHLEGNSPAHMKASLIGSSISVIIEEGNLRLGTWQGIFFCEFDGPRKRKVFIHLSS